LALPADIADHVENPAVITTPASVIHSLPSRGRGRLPDPGGYSPVHAPVIAGHHPLVLLISPRQQPQHAAYRGADQKPARQKHDRAPDEQQPEKLEHLSTPLRPQSAYGGPTTGRPISGLRDLLAAEPGTLAPRRCSNDDATPRHTKPRHGSSLQQMER
jgi:hypothetical protein